ncbi:hypothetical protein GCM10010123_05090 [Pilimelia anulata]|uniref:N-acetyltransferase domain-containing protein n=1 Tax=Pilimelia anulata TaxID=53371 RepID=A0A8J3AZE2_9ACTN|nr:hypothetical protein GCM10010123_05090 [Pilimelia anulata]
MNTRGREYAGVGNPGVGRAGGGVGPSPPAGAPGGNARIPAGSGGGAVRGGPAGRGHSIGRMVETRSATFDRLDARTLYGILRLRAAVFVVEQDCAYQDLDGRDLEPAARHLWAEGDGGGILGYLRILADPDGTPRIGRVVVAPDARGTGVVQRLMRAALEHVGDRPSVLAAQAHLERFYAGFGYRTCGPGYDEDGIPHLPMRRDAPATDRPAAAERQATERGAAEPTATEPGTGGGPGATAGR